LKASLKAKTQRRLKKNKILSTTKGQSSQKKNQEEEGYRPSPIPHQVVLLLPLPMIPIVKKTMRKVERLKSESP